MNIAACTEILAIAPDQHHSHIRATMAFHDPLTERLQEFRVFRVFGTMGTLLQTLNIEPPPESRVPQR